MGVTPLTDSNRPIDQYLMSYVLIVNLNNSNVENPGVVVYYQDG